MKKSCLNCMRVIPIYDGGNILRHKCMQNPDMPVNGRMHCEEWVSNDVPPFRGSFSVASFTKN